MRQPRQRLVAALSAVFLLAQGLACAEPISKITIEGLQNVNPRLVQLTLTIAEGQEYNRAAVLSDFRAVMDLGLFDPAKSSVDVDKQPDGVHVLFRLVENPKIRQIRITGATIFPEQKLIQAIADVVRVGDVFNSTTTQLVYQRLQELYRKRGLELAMEQPTITADGVLEYRVAEGHIAAVTVRLSRPNCIKTEQLIAWLGIKEGQLFNYDELKRKTQAAQDLGLFEAFTANILPGRSLGAREIVFNCTCLRRPRPSPEGLKMVDFQRLIANLDSYRDRFFAFRYDLSPPPAQASVRQLQRRAQGTGQRAEQARYELVLALAQLRRREEAARAAQPLIEALRARLAQNPGDGEARARLARLLVIAGMVDEAVAISWPAVENQTATPDLLATAVHALILKLGEEAAAAQRRPRAKLPEIGWVLAVLSRAPRDSAAFRSETAQRFRLALQRAAEHFASLRGEQIWAELEPFLRFMAVADFLQTLDTPVRPTRCAPLLEGRLGHPVFVTFCDAPLEEALRARVASAPDDLRAAYALGCFLVCREVAIRTRTEDIGRQLGLAEEDRTREIRRAARLFEKIISRERAPDHFPGARTYLAVARGLGGRISEAQDILLQALELPDEPGAGDVYIGTCISTLFIGKGDSQRERQMLEQGRKKLAQYIAAGRGGARAREVAFTLDGIAGDVQKAAAEAEKLAQEEPQNAAAWTALGFYRLKLGKINEALLALRRAVELSPGDPYAQYTLGLAEILAGDTENGRKRLAAVEIETLLDRVSSVVGL